MLAELESSLLREAEKHIRRYSSRAQQHARHRKYYEKRTGQHGKKPLSFRPKHWDLEQQFDPFYVRAHAKSIAVGLSRSIKQGVYAPRPAIQREIPKPSGGSRAVTMFSVVD